METSHKGVEYARGDADTCPEISNFLVFVPFQRYWLYSEAGTTRLRQGRAKGKKCREVFNMSTPRHVLLQTGRGEAAALKKSRTSHSRSKRLTIIPKFPLTHTLLLYGP